MQSPIMLGNAKKGNGMMQSALKEQAELDATKSIVSVAKKARDLYQQQQKIERDVQTRCVHSVSYTKCPGCSQ